MANQLESKKSVKVCIIGRYGMHYLLLAFAQHTASGKGYMIPIFIVV